MKRAWIVAACLVAANQRPALASVSPLLDRIAGELGLTGAQAGALATAPLLMMGIGAPVASAGARRFSAEAVMLVGLALIACGCALRWTAHGYVSLLATTALVGVGITFIGTLMPSLIAARGSGTGSNSVEALTGFTTFSLTLGAVVASAVSVPLADRYGWQPALAAWALLALVSAAAWVAVTAKADRPASRGESVSSVWREPTAWMLAAYFGIQTLHFYTALTWIPSTYAAAGISPRESGLMLTAMAFGNMVGAFSGPILLGRVGATRAAAGTIMVSFAMTGLMAFTPTTAPLVVSLVLGLSLGGGFGICLTLLVRLANSSAASSSLSGMASLIAYLVGAFGPLMVGAASDSLGFGWAWAIVMGLCLAQLLLLPLFGEERRGSIGRRTMDAESSIQAGS